MIGLMVTLLLTGACEYLVDPLRVGPEKFVSRGLASVIYPIDPRPANLAALFRWMHSLLILVFLNYLPYSKHLHVVTSLINVYLSNTSGPGQKGVMRPMDLEAEVDQFGASDVSISRGRICSTGTRAPVWALHVRCVRRQAGKVLSPRKIVINTRRRLGRGAPS